MQRKNLMVSQDIITDNYNNSENGKSPPSGGIFLPQRIVKLPYGIIFLRDGMAKKPKVKVEYFNLLLPA